MERFLLEKKVASSAFIFHSWTLWLSEDLCYYYAYLWKFQFDSRARLSNAINALRAKSPIITSMKYFHAKTPQCIKSRKSNHNFHTFYPLISSFWDIKSFGMTSDLYAIAAFLQISFGVPKIRVRTKDITYSMRSSTVVSPGQNCYQLTPDDASVSLLSWNLFLKGWNNKS